MSRFTPKPQTRKKEFSWSYSRLKNFEACARKHWHVDIAKDFEEPPSDALDRGDYVHKSLADAISGTAPLPDDLATYQHWVDKLKLKGEAHVFVEQKLAIHEDKRPAEFMGKAWFRGVVDYMKLVQTRAGFVALAIDWKTGKPLDDSVQLALVAALLFSHYMLLEKVRTEFVWLKDDTEDAPSTTREDWSRADMDDLWVSLKPRIDALKHAHETGEYHPMKGRLCRKYCPVTSCEFHGK